MILVNASVGGLASKTPLTIKVSMTDSLASYGKLMSRMLSGTDLNTVNKYHNVHTMIANSPRIAFPFKYTNA